MKRNHRRTRKIYETAINAAGKTINDQKVESKSKE